MTVKELKEKLNEFPDNLVVMIPNMDWTPFNNQFECTPDIHICRGINEFDGCLFIDDYVEDDDD